ncbi:MAG: glycosyltransferase family 39 protein [Candidatus Levyibacteriota bacterium]|nr:MAG: glycosyltransferase family 39 protein [Candidatus Levybacteria bacterium]
MKGFLSIFLVLFFSFVAARSLLAPGLPPTHDGEYHIIRFYEFDKTLRAGDLYPRWAQDLNNGYGVPLFNYVYPLPNYIASFFHLFGVSFIDAFKLSMFFAAIVGSIAMYLWAKIFWGEVGGVVSSVFYTFAPYHFVDIYVRGSVGEVWALAFFPAFLWSATVFIKERRPRFVVLSGIFLSLIIFSHNILALMFFPFALFYVLFLIFFSKEKLYAIRYTLYAIFLGLGLSAIFWLPAIFEANYVKGLQIYDIENNFPELYQLFIPSWGSGFSNDDLPNQMSPQIGIANIFSLLGTVIVLIILLRRKQKSVSLLILFFLLWFTVVFFLLLPASLPIWLHVPLMNYFQFPWRLLSLEILFLAFLAGSMIMIWKNKIFLALMVIFPIVLGVGYAKPPFYFNRDDIYYISRSNFIDGTNSPGDLFNTVWFNKGLKKQKEKILVGHGMLTDVQINPTKYLLRVEVNSDSQVTVNTVYFPGWTAMINKKEIDTKPDNNGLITFFVPESTNYIVLFFKNTFVRMIATSISLVSFFSIILYLVLYFRYEKK